MLQKMRDQTQSLAFKVLVGLLVVVLAIFGFGAFNLFVGGDPEIASVNGEGITEREVAVATERERRRIAAQMGEDFDASEIDPVRLQSQVLDQLISRSLLSQAADEMGVGVSREQAERMLVSTPSFQIDGTFDPDLYRQAVQAMGYTPQTFMTETSELMALDQIRTTLAETSLLTDREVNLHARLLAQRRDVAYLPFTVDAFRDEVTVSDEEVRLRYEENQLAYMTEERVDAAYVSLSVEDLMDDPSIEVTEDALREAYQAERAMAPAEEERRARHILLETGGQRTAEQALERLEEIRQRIAGGESFEEVAREVSEDPGSAAQGGDLGFAGRGVFDPAFEQALFALEEPGDVSQPVETEFGYHLIQLEDIRTHDYPGFDEMRPELEQRLRREQAEALYEERLRELDSLAFEQPNSLDAIVGSLGLERRTVEGVTREQGPPPFDDPEIRQALFATDVLDQGYNSAALERDGQAIVARVTEHHQPEPVPFEEVAGRIREEIELERARALARDAQTAARTRLEAGESAAEVAAGYDLSWQTFEGVRRGEGQMPPAVAEAAFALPRPAPNGKTIGRAELPYGAAVVTVTRVEEADPSTLPESELAGMRRFLARRAADQEFNAFFQSLRQDASVRRPEL